MRTRIDPFNPPPPTEALPATPQRLAVLELFTRYEFLPTSYIRKATGIATHTLASMNKGHLIGIPTMEGSRTIDSRNREATWQILPRGEAMLGKPAFHSADNSYKHKLLISLCKFSFDRAEHEIPGLIKHTLADILMDARCPEATRKDPTPNWIPIGDYALIPDEELFGYELNGRFFFIHGFEAHRYTETGRSKLKRKTVESMVRNYGRYIKEGIYWHRYGLQNVLIPILCDSVQAFNEAMNIVKQDLDPDLWKNIVGKVISTDPRNFPPPTAHLVTDDYFTADGTTFNILEVLNGQTRTSTESGRHLEGDKAA